MSDDLRSYYESAAIPKVYRAKKTPKRIRHTPKAKEERDRIAEVRDFVFARERGRCRCCRSRAADSMHELRPRSLRGRVSKTNSIAVCGSGTTGCHGLIQTKRIGVVIDPTRGAEASLYFCPRDQGARDWMRLGDKHGLESAPMRELEDA